MSNADASVSLVFIKQHCRDMQELLAPTGKSNFEEIQECARQITYYSNNLFMWAVEQEKKQFNK